MKINKQKEEKVQKNSEYLPVMSRLRCEAAGH